MRGWGEGLRGMLGGLIPSKETVRPQSSHHEQKPRTSQEAKQKKEAPELRIGKNENIADFLVRAREKHKGEEKQFDYIDAGLKAISDQKRQRDIEQYGEGWVGRINRKLTETDFGLSVEVGSKAVAGALAFLDSFFLQGETAMYASPVLYAMGGSLYGSAMLRAYLSFGEARLRELVQSLRKDVKKEIQKLSGEKQFVNVNRILADIKKSHDLMKEKEVSLEKKELHNKILTWLPPKFALAACIAAGIPIPAGFQDLDKVTGPDLAQAHLTFTNLAKSDFYYIVQSLGSLGNQFGGYISQAADVASRVAPDVYKGIGEKVVFGGAAVGTGIGLFATEVTTKATDYLVTLAGKSVRELQKILGKKPTAKDIRKIQTKTIPDSTKKTVETSAIPRLSQEEWIGVMNEFRARAGLPPLEEDVQGSRGKGKDTGSKVVDITTPPRRRARPAPEKPRIAQKTTPLVIQGTGILKPEERLELPESTRAVRDLALSDSDWNLPANDVRARIQQGLGFTTGEVKGIPYKQFKENLKDYIARAQARQLNTLENFLVANDEYLNGTDDGGVIVMWSDRKHLQKLIAHRREEIAKQQYEEQQKAIKEFEERAKHEPSPVAWSDLRAEEERKVKAAQEDLETKVGTDERFGVRLDELLHDTELPERKVEIVRPEKFTLESLLEEAALRDKQRELHSLKKAKRTLAAYLERRVDPQTIGLVRKGMLNPHGDKDFPGKKILQEADTIHTWDKKKVAGRLLHEVSALASSFDRMNAKLNPTDLAPYQRVWTDISKLGTLKSKNLLDVKKDKEEGWMYRGRPVHNFDTSNIDIRGRMDITIDHQAIHTLDAVASNAGFFYRIGQPSTENDPARHNDSVTLYFPDGLPSQKVLDQLARIAQDHRRGSSGEELIGRRYNSHFYISEEFIGNLPKDQEEALLKTLKKIDTELYRAMDNFASAKGGISEAGFHAIKTTLYAFGFPISYSKEKGVVFLRAAKQESVA